MPPPGSANLRAEHYLQAAARPGCHPVQCCQRAAHLIVVGNSDDIERGVIFGVIQHGLDGGHAIAVGRVDV